MSLAPAAAVAFLAGGFNISPVYSQLRLSTRASPVQRRHGPEELGRLVHRHLEHVGDGLALGLDVQRLAIVAVALADVAGDDQRSSGFNPVRFAILFSIQGRSPHRETRRSRQAKRAAIASDAIPLTFDFPAEPKQRAARAGFRRSEPAHSAATANENSSG